MVALGEWKTYFRFAWKLALFIGILVGASYTGNWVMEQLSGHLTPSTEPMLHRLIMTATAVYILLMMLPFVPGVEIGLGMIATLGPKIAPLVYVSTVLALSLSFLIGRLVPQERVIRAFRIVRLNRAAELLRNVHDLAPEERLGFILAQTSSRFVPLLLRYRFIALMIALNIPGNAVIGGGGGISLIAGFSRLFPFHSFLIAVAIAVAPVPLFLFFLG